MSTPRFLISVLRYSSDKLKDAAEEQQDALERFEGNVEDYVADYKNKEATKYHDSFFHHDIVIDAPASIRQEKVADESHRENYNNKFRECR